MAMRFRKASDTFWANGVHVDTNRTAILEDKFSEILQNLSMYLHMAHTHEYLTHEYFTPHKKINQ